MTRPFIADAKSLHTFAALLDIARASEWISQYDGTRFVGCYQCGTHEGQPHEGDCLYAALDRIDLGWREWQP